MSAPREPDPTPWLYAATVLYLAYHLAIRPAVVARIFPSLAHDDRALRTRIALFRRALGTLLFGLVPAIYLALSGIPLARLGLNLDVDPTHLALALGFPLVLSPLLLAQSKKPRFLDHYPEVRTAFTNQLRLQNALSWTAYLLAYEFFFRGVLLLGLVPAIGPDIALAVSTMGYVWVHLDKYPGEAIGSLVSGLVFGLLTLASGSILPAFLGHLLIALLTDELAARGRQ